MSAVTLLTSKEQAVLMGIVVSITLFIFTFSMLFITPVHAFEIPNNPSWLWDGGSGIYHLAWDPDNVYFGDLSEYSLTTSDSIGYAPLEYEDTLVCIVDSSAGTIAYANLTFSMNAYPNRGEGSFLLDNFLHLKNGTGYASITWYPACNVPIHFGDAMSYFSYEGGHIEPEGGIHYGEMYGATWCIATGSHTVEYNYQPPPTEPPNCNIYADKTGIIQLGETVHFELAIDEPMPDTVGWNLTDSTGHNWITSGDEEINWVSSATGTYTMSVVGNNAVGTCYDTINEGWIVNFNASVIPTPTFEPIVENITITVDIPEAVNKTQMRAYINNTILGNVTTPYLDMWDDFFESLYSLGITISSVWITPLNTLNTNLLIPVAEFIDSSITLLAISNPILFIFKEVCDIVPIKVQALFTFILASNIMMDLFHRGW